MTETYQKQNIPEMKVEEVKLAKQKTIRTGKT